MVKLLIELGADPTIEDRSYHATPLGWAEHTNQEEVVDYLTALRHSGRKSEGKYERIRRDRRPRRG